MRHYEAIKCAPPNDNKSASIATKDVTFLKPMEYIVGILSYLEKGALNVLQYRGHPNKLTMFSTQYNDYEENPKKEKGLQCTWVLNTNKPTMG